MGVWKTSREAPFSKSIRQKQAPASAGREAPSEWRRAISGGLAEAWQTAIRCPEAGRDRSAVGTDGASSRVDGTTRMDQPGPIRQDSAHRAPPSKLCVEALAQHLGTGLDLRLRP